MRFASGLLLLTVTAAGAVAQQPRVVRKPAAEFLAEKSEGPENGIFQADLSPDGKLVALVRQNGKLTVHAVGQAKPLFTTGPAERRGSPYTVGAAFSADGASIAVPGGGRRIDVLKATTGKLHASIELPGRRSDGIDALTFSPDGKKLAVASGFLYHKALRVFDAATGKLLGQPLDDVDGSAHPLLFSPDGKSLVANHWGAIYLVDAAYRLVRKVPARAASVFFHKGELRAVEPESSSVVAVGEKGLGTDPLGKWAGQLDSVAGMRMAIAGDPPVAAIPQKGKVSVRNAQGRESFQVVGEDSPVRRLCLSADGRVLLVYRDSLRVEVFRLE